MTRSKAKFQLQKNREAESALQKILAALTGGKANTKRLNVWPTPNGIGISAEIDYETKTPPTKNSK